MRVSAAACTDAAGDPVGETAVGGDTGGFADATLQLQLAEGEAIDCLVELELAATLALTPVSDDPAVSGAVTFRALTPELLEAILAAGNAGGGLLPAIPLDPGALIASLPPIEVTVGQTHTLEGLTTGPYIVALDEPGVGVSAIDCRAADDVPVGDVDLTAGSVTLQLASGEAVECTVELEPASTGITVTPRTTPPGSAENPDSDVTDSTPDPTAALPAPRPGRWRAVNGRGKITCGGFKQTIPAGDPGVGRLQVRQDGDRLIARGIAEGTSKPIRFDRDPTDPARWIGKVNLRVQGVSARFTFTMELLKESRFEGVLRANARFQGQNCRISRPFVLSYAGND